MRIGLLFFMLILLPLATGVHAWLFCRENLPLLTQEAVRRLKEARVADPVVEVRFFDIAVTGVAPDPAARDKALASIRSLVPLRLQPGADRIHVIASLKARLEQNILRLSGWLPEGEETRNISGLFTELRTDLTVDATDLRTAPGVRWPEGFKPPLTTGSPMLKPIIDTLRVPAELHIRAKEDAVVLSGLLPSAELKEEIVVALAEVAGAREVDPAALKAGPHVLSADFAKGEALAAFVRAFFAAPPPRSFDIGADGIPHLAGFSTRQMESQWLTLLRPVTGAAKVDAQQVSLVPSIYHFPGYQVQSRLPPEALDSLRGVLRGFVISFDVGSTQIPAAQQSRLAALAPTLLAAGPALGLVIGAHPDPKGPASVERQAGQARAEAVLSFLIDQGVPSADVNAVVFDPVPPGSAAASILPRSVEIIIK